MNYRNWLQLDHSVNHVEDWFCENYHGFRHELDDYV
jgi:hypothetical protein